MVQFKASVCQHCHHFQIVSILPSEAKASPHAAAKLKHSTSATDGTEGAKAAAMRAFLEHANVKDRCDAEAMFEFSIEGGSLTSLSVNVYNHACPNNVAHACRQGALNGRVSKSPLT